MPEIKSKWNFRKYDKDTVLKLSKELNIYPVTAKILISRGYDTKEKIIKFFNKSAHMLHDPFLLEDMTKAVERINRAVTNGEKIMIYGDYDVDGITATYIIYCYLRQLNADVLYYIPDRFEEGYGINKNALDKAFNNKINLIITVDTGVTAVEEVEYARHLGIDLVITDHHECPDILPEAAAVVNPRRKTCNYPFKELAGVGVAFKLLCAYNIKYELKGKISLGEYFEFVAMGTISDIMPLTGENMILTYIGLKYMQNSKNHGVQAILECCSKGKSDKDKMGKNKDKKDKIVSAEVVSYGIAPRLNAAGRLSKADKVLDLFMAQDCKAAALVADELSNLNKQRQAREKEIFSQAVNKMASGINYGESKIAVLYHDDWNQGVIGIVASKLVEKYNKAIVLLTKDSSGICKGSCRSIKNINITEALRACSDILVQYGGHELAAGLMIEYENIEELGKRLNEYIDDNNIEIETTKLYDIDSEINIAEMQLTCVNELSRLEPFGVGNPMPLFAVCKCEIMSITPIGDNKHLKLALKSMNISFEALNFNVTPDEFKFNVGDITDIVCNVSINSFLGRESVQYIIRDIRYSEEYNEKYISDIENYNKFCNGAALGETIEIIEYDIPDREDFKAVYIFLLKLFPKGSKHSANCSVHQLKDKFTEHCEHCEHGKKDISYFRFRVILDIFNEMNIITIEYNKNSKNSIRSIIITQVQGKIELEQSKIYQKMI